MRWTATFFAMALAATPLQAEASTATCAATLLNAPTDSLYRALRITPAQASGLDQLRVQREQLEVELEQVRAELAGLGPWDGARRHELELRQAGLEVALSREPARVASLLDPWQRSRCAGEIYLPAPVVVRPAPRRVVRRVVVRAPRLVPVPPRPDVYRVPVRKTVHRAPARPAVHRAPVRKTVYRAPARPAPAHKPVKSTKHKSHH